MDVFVAVGLLFMICVAGGMAGGFVVLWVGKR